MSQPKKKKPLQLTRKSWAERQAAAKRNREALILAHAFMVEKIARQVHAKMTHVPIEELERDGWVGLVEAASKYSKAKGIFEHYAYFRVRGSMIDAHKRSAYRDETHESIDAIHERLGFLPAHLSQDRGLLPDEIASRREQAHLLASAVAELPADEKRLFIAALAGTPLLVTATECGHSVAWARTKLAAARSQLGARVLSWGIGLEKAA